MQHSVKEKVLMSEKLLQLRSPRTKHSLTRFTWAKFSSAAMLTNGKVEFSATRIKQLICKQGIRAGNAC